MRAAPAPGAQVLARMKQLMVDNNTAASHSFLLDDDSSIPFSLDDIAALMEDKARRRPPPSPPPPPAPIVMNLRVRISSHSPVEWTSDTWCVSYPFQPGECTTSAAGGGPALSGTSPVTSARVSLHGVYAKRCGGDVAGH